ncbi:hypothetical protein [Sphingomonas phyllosphaerae]|uniref:hypothetical protein n=1 Tax=Sphingomonas phyllosphaerae TaxID=257003 RepID=UPI0024135CF4|nr:hypothetical protein [Sphingomonas phyllosphaerae]
MHSIAALALALAAVAVPAARERARPRDAAEKAADRADKMVCKRFTKTGSLVDRVRVCKTKNEWQRDRDNLRNSAASGTCGQPTLNGC